MLVQDINPGPFSAFPRIASDSAPLSFLETWPLVAGVVFLPADDGARGVELWETDGTNEGTRLVKELNPFGDSIAFFNSTRGGPGMAVAGETLFLNATDGASGRSLWAVQKR